MSIPQRYRDSAYLLIVGGQLFGMIALDLVPFYPKSLWQGPSSPLHFLVQLRETYVNLSGDPFFTHEQHDPWFQAFMYIELAAQFPLALYLVWRLVTGGKNTSAQTELAGLAFGCLTGMGSVTCCFHLWQLPEDAVTSQQKTMLFYGEYLPFAVIPFVMAVDMHQRLLTRLSGAEGKAKKQ